jgi:hypothetical protein
MKAPKFPRCPICNCVADVSVTVLLYFNGTKRRAHSSSIPFCVACLSSPDNDHATVLSGTISGVLKRLRSADPSIWPYVPIPSTHAPDRADSAGSSLSPVEDPATHTAGTQGVDPSDEVEMLYLGRRPNHSLVTFRRNRRPRGK